jgi:hypothetical protein
MALPVADPPKHLLYPSLAGLVKKIPAAAPSLARLGVLLTKGRIAGLINRNRIRGETVT